MGNSGINWLFGKDGALFQACASGDVGTARELMDSGADVNAVSSDGFTPLHRAAQNGQDEIVRMLLAGGARCDVHAKDGSTATSMAAAAGHAAIVTMLQR